MKSLKFLALTMVLAAMGPAAFAIDDKSDEMWQKLYQKLITVMHSGSASSREMGKDNIVVCLNVPGIAVADMEKDNKEDTIQIATMLDETAEYGPVYKPGKRQFSKNYEDILDYHQSDPPPEISKADKAALAAALEDISPDGKYMPKYLECEEVYINACVAQEEARWEKKPMQKVNRDVNNAETAWIAQGFKNKVWNAFDTIVTKSAKDPAAWWTKLRRNFNNAKLTDRDGAGVYSVTTYPPIHLWGGDKGWVEFTYSASKKTNSKQVTEQDRSMSANLNFGLKKVKGSVSHEMQAMKELSSDDSLKISMQMKRVLISKPWFDWQVFESTAWTWDRGLISDGKGGGTMPLFVNSILIVRKVKFESKKIDSLKESIKKELKYDAKGSYGPFSMETKGRDKSENESSLDTEEEGSITIEDPQILGYICTIVPPCPAKVANAKPDKPDKKTSKSGK